MKKTKLFFKLNIVFGLLLFNKSNAQEVNKFTGGFSYSSTLMSLPSPYGPAVPIRATYGSGIQVEQSAGEIGLGWDLGIGGAITRNISGIPDDWSGVTTADPKGCGFKTSTGVMFFNNDTPADNLDFYQSTYKIDTPAFYFPDYDYYNVSGPGIGGSLKPRLFDFATTELNVPAFDGNNNPLLPIPFKIDATYDFDKTLQFYFDGNFNGDFKSRHYPSTPISGSTTLRFSGNNDNVTDNEYTSSTIPYTGLFNAAESTNVGFDQTTNRLASAKYVAYITGTYGIETFTITDEKGFVYKYTIPVYMNYVIHGNYPLKNDYTMGALDTTRVTSGDNYYIKENTLADVSYYTPIPYFVEWKEGQKYAYKWLLTSVTGPDYEDSNSSGTVNSGDKGYWVVYDWQLWSDNFTKRIPEYGFDYSFVPDDKTQDKGVLETGKISGKFASFTKYNQEVYYLNKVQTSSHTAIMVRDIRNDEYGSQTYIYDNQLQYTSDMPANIFPAPSPPTKTTSYGTLYDDGGSAGNYTASYTNSFIISPTGASSITIRFNYMNMVDSTNDKVNIRNTSTGALLATYSGTIPINPVTFNYSSITVEQVTNNVNNSGGFRLSWSSSIHPTVTPQLKLQRIVLLKNEDLTSLNSPSSSSSYYASTSISSFDMGNVHEESFYNETWYNHVNNKSSIESKSLQTIEFNQDYSLARKYHNNVKTIVTGTDKHSSQAHVLTGLTIPSADYATSGKLTLNEITVYDLAHVKTSPSVLFDYNASVTTDNPNYNPVKVDYWGFYKSDATANGFSGYTNDASKDSTDAWSLRKITSPLGGTTEITYESNQYEKVFNGNGGFRGPSKMYMIKTATENNADAVEWVYAMEEGSSTISDFESMKTNYSTGAHIFIPSYSDAIDTKFISSGTFTFGTSSTAESISNVYYSATPFALNSPYYSGTTTGVTDYVYTGNGYIHFDLPIGTAQYGGGVRVKKLTTKNGTTDTYVKEYVYNEGVTPMEADRFAEEKLTIVNYASQGVAHYTKLMPANYDLHRMGPGIGYTKVTEKNLGQINASNGSTQYTFITSDAGIPNYDATIVEKVGGITHPSGFEACSTQVDTSFIIEVTDKFSGYWGQGKEIQTSDINGNVISKTVNEFTNLSQGAVVENYDFLNKLKHLAGYMGEPSICYQLHHIVCIKREYPVVLSKQTVYGQGASVVTENISFDKITGEPIQTRLTSPNKGIRVTRKYPAFRISQYSAMGPKSVTSTNKNVLEPIAYSRTTVDSTITSSSDFTDFTIQTYKKDLNIRSFDATAGKFISSVQNNKYWMSDKSYIWAGANTSLDNYGLFKNSEIPTPFFDYSLTSNDSKWRLTTENTLVDGSGHLLEIKGFNDRFSAKKYGHGDSLQIAEASNVNYPSFTVCGFESQITDLDPGAGVANYFEGEVKVNTGTKENGAELFPPHTGNYMVTVGPSAASGPEYSVIYKNLSPNSGLQKNRTYRASVWVHSSSSSDCKLSISFTGLTTQVIEKSSASITAGDWLQMTVEISVPASPSDNDELKVFLTGGTTGSSYFDDLRLQPVEATVTATVFDYRTNRIMATLDANNFATIYKYDAGGRVTEIWQEIEGIGMKRLKKYQYNFARGLN